jgi:hypothetical protein
LSRRPPPTVVNAVILLAADAHNVSYNALLARARPHRVSMARALVWMLLRKHYGTSWPELARILRRSDHTSPLRAVAKELLRQAKDPERAALAASIWTRAYAPESAERSLRERTLAALAPLGAVSGVTLRPVGATRVHVSFTMELPEAAEV